MASDKVRILVAEPSTALASALRKYLESAGFEVSHADTLESVGQRLRNSEVRVVIGGADGLDSAALCKLCREVSPLLPVVLVYSPDADDSCDQRAAAAGADGFLVGPIKRGNVLGIVQAMLRVRELTDESAGLEQEIDRRIQIPGAGQRSEQLQGDFDFFKRLLNLEVRRSRRYKYPLSFLLVSIDRFREEVAGMDPKAVGKLVGQLLSEAVKSVRDVDLCVLFAEDKLLVFAPHTPAEGATRVGRRLVERLGAVEAEGKKVTVSVGIAGYDGKGGAVSFGGLLRDASDAVRKAQAEGGNRVEMAGGGGGKSRSSGRDRISMA